MKFVQFIVKGSSYRVPPNGTVNPTGEMTDRSIVRNAIRTQGGPQSPVYQFIRCLTTCHTVIREKNGTYRSESPDELALVEVCMCACVHACVRSFVLMHVWVYSVRACCVRVHMRAWVGDLVNIRLHVLDFLFSPIAVRLLLMSCRLSESIRTFHI